MKLYDTNRRRLPYKRQRYYNDDYDGRLTDQTDYYDGYNYYDADAVYDPNMMYSNGYDQNAYPHGGFSMPSNYVDQGNYHGNYQYQWVFYLFFFLTSHFLHTHIHFLHLIFN